MKSKMCRFISDVCSGSRVGCNGSCKCRRHACRYSQKIRDCGLRIVRRERGSVSEKAPLQDQLSKRMRVGWPRVQQERRGRIAEISEQPAILKGKMDIGNIAVTSCPTFRDSWNNSTQDFAALHLRRLFLLFFRFGMKRASRLRRIVFCCHRRERAMIRDRKPGTDRNRNGHTAHARFHIQCWFWSARTRPRF
jgi:hypothetical protein